MSHAARHAPDEFQLFRHGNLLFQPDLIDNQAQVFDQQGQQMQIVGRVRLPTGFFAQQQYSEGIIAGKKRKTELRVE